MDAREAIRKFRKIAGVTQAEFASCAGISRQMLSGYERGTRKLSLAAMLRIQKAIENLKILANARLMILGH